MEITLKRPELEDKELIKSYLKERQPRSCELTFGNIYLWSKHYDTGFTVIEESLVLGTIGENPVFNMPLGGSNKKVVIDKLMAYCEEQGLPFQMQGVTQEDFEQLETWYPGLLEIEFNRDYADYVYETEKLIKLSGKKYHGKKNHVNKFRKLYANWSYEKITPENIEECFQMALRWRELNCAESDLEKHAEICVTMNSLRLLEELDFKGGLLRVDGEVVAFSIGEEVSDDTLVVHIEKAFAGVEGAYTMINQQFLEHEGQNYTYVNREEDMGEEGLRKAKLSYRPVFLIEKGKVKKK